MAVSLHYFEFLTIKRIVLTRGIAFMDPELLVKMKTAYLELRLAQLVRGQVMSEDDALCEQRITAHLSTLARIWAKQSEKFYDDNFPSGDDTPPPTPGGEGGPVPAK